MNLTMQPPISYPYYMDSPRFSYHIPWPSDSFHYSRPVQQHIHSNYQTSPALPQIPYQLPFLLPHSSQQNLHHKPMNSYSSYTNTRYNQLKQSTSHASRHRSIDPTFYSQHYSMPTNQYRPYKTKSVTDFQQSSQQNSPYLLKAHSWHSINHLNQSNFNINYANQISSIDDNSYHHYQNIENKMKSSYKQQRLSSSKSSPKQCPKTFNRRLSKSNEMPIINNPIYHESTIDFHHNQIKDILKQASPSSTDSSHSSLQKRLNGSLRNDPLLNAAMEDFQQLRRTSSQSTTLTPQRRELSRDSLCSDSTRCSSSSSSPISHRKQARSSFTSLERLEIRNLINAIKTKGLQPLDVPAQLIPNAPQFIEQIPIKKSSLETMSKQKKSSITEELDEQFKRIRSNNPNEELIYVRPSLIQKQRTSYSQLPNNEQLKYEISTLKEINIKTYENPILNISIPQSTPILKSQSIDQEHRKNDDDSFENKPEYATPIKKTSEVKLRTMKKEEQTRSFSFCKSIDDIVNETNSMRPLSMFNLFHCGLTNPLPATFQPNKSRSNSDKILVKENIYASDIDVHLPLSNDKSHMNNKTIISDYCFDNRQKTKHSSILSDFSRLFTRFGNHKRKQKCVLKTNLNKNNNNNNNNNNVRCSIM